MNFKDLFKKLQTEMNAQGEKLKVDGDPGMLTRAALENFDVTLEVKRREGTTPQNTTHPLHPIFKIPAGCTHLHPFDILKFYEGQREIVGSKNNPIIAHFHEHSGNLGTHSDTNDYSDEVAHCSSALNFVADMGGAYKTDNALANSWDNYIGVSLKKGTRIPKGAIVRIRHASGGNHVTLAEQDFTWDDAGSFIGFGSNQGNAIKISAYRKNTIKTVHVFMAKPGVVWAPIGTIAVLKTQSPIPDPEPGQTPTGKISTGQDPDEATPAWYRRMWNACEVLPEKKHQLESTVDIVKAGGGKYFDVAMRLNAANPKNFAAILGVIHFKEASCDFAGCLHNGERIIGSGAKTKLVPKGRGPFRTWSDSAVDAITFEQSKWEKLLNGSTDISEVLFALEKFNGLGYVTGSGKAENSPYLWACSNINDGKGKYTSDGHFDSEASTGATCGGALILKELAKQGVFLAT